MAEPRSTFVGCRRRGRVVEVEAERPIAERRQVRQQRRLREHDRRLHIAEHELETLARIRGIEREIAGAGLENAQQSDDALDRTSDRNRHRDTGTDAPRAEARGQPVRLPLELAVAHRTVAEDDRRLFRILVHPFFHELVQAASLGERRRGGIPGHDQLVALRSRQHRHVVYPLIGVPRHVVDQRAEMAEQSIDRGAIEQVGAVAQSPAQPALVFPEVEQQVVLGRGSSRAESASIAVPARSTTRSARSTARPSTG